MNTGIGPAHVESFYQASLVGLRLLEQRGQGRSRFGADADALWQGFSGHLTATDRIDLLLRDASMTWAAAFAPARVFGFPGLADDEPFGPDWRGVDEILAKRLWKAAASEPLPRWEAALDQALTAWGLEVTPSEPPEALSPATRVLVVGPSAVAGAIRLFAGREDLRWSEQVVVVASAPAARHLAGLGALLVSGQGPTRLVSPTDSEAEGAQPAARVKAAGMTAVDVIWESDDAAGDDRAFARQAATQGAQ